MSHLSYLVLSAAPCVESTSGQIMPGSAELNHRPAKLYNLDVIISVGYRVKSKRGIAFRKWADSVLMDYIIKGYAVNTTHINQPNKVIRIMKRAQNDSDTQQVLSVIKRYNRHWICWMALSPFDTPTRNDDTLPLNGEHTAVSCYQPCGLYRHR